MDWKKQKQQHLGRLTHSRAHSTKAFLLACGETKMKPKPKKSWGNQKRILKSINALSPNTGHLPFDYELVKKVTLVLKTSGIGSMDTFCI
ncbi:hypothetical protein ACLKA7_006898 [Drosophila subpalustris]